MTAPKKSLGIEKQFGVNYRNRELDFLLVFFGKKNNNLIQ